MDILSAILCAVTGSGVTAIVLALLQRKWAKDDKQDAVIAGLKVLTVDRVRYLGKCYIAEGEITLEDKENLEEMHRAYKALGGNGHLDTVMRGVEKLPIRDGENHEKER